MFCPRWLSDTASSRVLSHGPLQSNGTSDIERVSGVSGPPQRVKACEHARLSHNTVVKLPSISSTPGMR